MYYIILLKTILKEVWDSRVIDLPWILEPIDYLLIITF